MLVQLTAISNVRGFFSKDASFFLEDCQILGSTYDSFSIFQASPSCSLGQDHVQILNLILKLLSAALIKAHGSYEWSVLLTIRALTLITN